MTGIAEGPLTALALCWRAERADGVGIALTSHDQQLVRGDIAHVPQPGVTPAAISRSIGLNPASSETAGVLSAAAFTERDLTLGRWDGAQVALTAVDWRLPDDDDDDVTLLAGELGEISVDGGSFSAELLGAAARLDSAPCPATSPECRAQLGDTKCRVDLAGRRVRATVQLAEGNRLNLQQGVEQRFAFGRLRYLSGSNCGLETIVLAVSGSEITVRDRPRASVDTETRVLLTEGCDKRFATCVERFDNAADFRGEPHLPGNDLLTRYPGV